MIENQVLLSNRTYSEVRTDAAKNGFETPSGDSGPGPSFLIYTSYRMRRLVVGCKRLVIGCKDLSLGAKTYHQMHVGASELGTIVFNIHVLSDARLVAGCM